MDETARKIYLAIDNNSDKEKSLEEIKTLVEEERGGDPSLVHYTPSEASKYGGRRPLAHAAMKGRDDVVGYLLDKHGADIEHRDAGLWTALHFAGLGDNDSHPVVISLLQRGANPMALNLFQRTPLIEAASDVTRPLTIGALLSDHCDATYIDYPGSAGCTALWESCFRGNAINTRVLLSRGADYNFVSSQQTTPMEVAKLEGHDECVAAIEAVALVAGKHK
jgi:ankyrin repeat protein